VACVIPFALGGFNSLMRLLPKFVLVYGFKMQVWYVMYIRIVGILYHDVGIIMGIPNHSVEPCRYCLLGFCSMMKFFRIMNTLSARIYPIFVQSLELSKPNRCQGTNYQKPLWAHVVNIYGINFLNLFNSYTTDIIIYILNVFWSMYWCEYGPKHY